MKLTDRQQEVLSHLGQCKSIKEIADVLRIDRHTVEKSLAYSRAETGLTNEELRQLALVLGLATVSPRVAVVAAQLKPERELCKRWVQRHD